MQEYVANAIVLKKEPLRDLDGRYALFTERFGKVVGKTTSSRKITSKLAPHLEPGMVTRVRYVEKGGTQIVDALKVGRLSMKPHDLHGLADVLAEGQPEYDLWTMLLGNDFSWPTALAMLGWDPRGAQCATCGRTDIAAFYPYRQEFFCQSCASRLGRDAISLS
ncbi:MAG TPA: recombination protein O N-terminal domain-containing protein [Candidatus Paceibacterota bacterium]|nr:recombination protein O N-terminal domain-containing protein [Candidatus Paceibacterota bacterium]